MIHGFDPRKPKVRPRISVRVGKFEASELYSAAQDAHCTGEYHYPDAPEPRRPLSQSQLE
jgi:hypothetical protein